MTAATSPAQGAPGAPPTVAALPATKPRGMFLRGLEVFLENKLAVVGAIVLVLIVGFCYLGPYFYHTNQITVNLANENLPPAAGRREVRPRRHDRPPEAQPLGLGQPALHAADAADLAGQPDLADGDQVTGQAGIGLGAGQR